jgi:hypothetical protein
VLLVGLQFLLHGRHFDDGRLVDVDKEGDERTRGLQLAVVFALVLRRMRQRREQVAEVEGQDRVATRTPFREELEVLTMDSKVRGCSCGNFKVSHLTISLRLAG